MTAPLPADVSQSIYRRMATISQSEQRIIKGLTSGEFTFVYYPVAGHEAIAATVGEILRQSDHLVSTYRCFHDVVAKGTPLREVIAEQMGRVGGTSKGKGGPMHISDPRSGLMATTGVVGAGAPIAVGLALAAQLDGSDRVAVVSFGDGATSIGAVHEAMNLAQVWDLPIVFLCQNNMWGEHTALADYTRTSRLADRATAYGMLGETVDGRRPEDLFPVLESAVERARRGEGPTFVEAITYRVRPHNFGSDQSYQPADELDKARRADPTARFRERLRESGLVSADVLSTIDADVQREIDEAVAWASASPQPGLGELLVDVYATPLEVIS